MSGVENQNSSIKQLQELYNQLDAVKQNSRFKGKDINELNREERNVLSQSILLRFGTNEQGKDIKIKQKTFWNRLVLWVEGLTEQYRFQDADIKKQLIRKTRCTKDP